MIAPTHSLFAGIICFAFGMPVQAVPYLIAGSLVPDIDHEKSFIGRIFFFISYPLNKKFGHRNITHSLLLWFPILVTGMKFKWVLWLSIGALSHLFLDMWTITGVGLFKPLTDKIYVMANKKFRLKVGSRNELILILVFALLLWGSVELYQHKGVRGVTREIMGSYDITLDDYVRNGLIISYVEGTFRENSGKIEENKRFLIIGEGESEGYLNLYDEKQDKMVDIPQQGKFIKSKVISDVKEWSTMKVDGVMEVKSIEGMAFQKAKKKWRKLNKGDFVIGTVNYVGSIELKISED